jgi:hypothetical protein
MNKKLIILIFSLAATVVFSQKKNEVIVTGTVYISSSVAPGVMNGKVLREGPSTFRKQPIYFKNDSITVKTLTDSLGIFSVTLKEGSYVVYQEAGLNGSKDQMTHYGSEAIEVKKGGGPYTISLHNSSNRRSTMNSGMSGKGLPGSKPTKTIKNTQEK